MKAPRILLIGIGGVYNYGCEAIIRGTEKILRREYPDAEIIYASRRPVDDRRRLVDSHVRIIDRPTRRRYSMKNVCRKALSLGGLRWDPRSDSLRLLEGIDAILSIGGDLYTLSASGAYSRSFLKFGDAARRRGIPYILWGASVGPFAKNPSAEKTYTKHLKRLNLITARETSTLEYLRSLGISENVVPCADPAYVVASEVTADDPQRNSRFTIGINFSPLSARYAGLNRQEAIYTQARVIERVVDVHGAQIVLVPHVLCDFNEDDDDLRYLRMVRDALANDYKNAVDLLESDAGFVGVKRELIKCNLVVAARMHCAINALAAHTPTILIGYSQKAFGMGDYVYGNRQWVIPFGDLAVKGILEDKVNAMKDREMQIRLHLASHVPEIQKDAYRAMHKLKLELETPRG